MTDGSAWLLPLASMLGRLSMAPVPGVELEKVAVAVPLTTIASEDTPKVWSSMTTAVELCRLSV